MGEGVSLQAMRVLLKLFAPQYRRALYQRKQVLLDIFAQAVGYHRRYGTWLLNHAEEVQHLSRAPRARTYGPEVQHVLFLVWHAANRICTKRLMLYCQLGANCRANYDEDHRKVGTQPYFSASFSFLTGQMEC